MTQAINTHPHPRGDRKRAREMYKKWRKKRDLVEKTCNQSVQFISPPICTAPRRSHFVKWPLRPACRTRSPEQRQKSVNKFSTGAWNTRMLLSTVYKGREKGNTEHKKLVKALMPNNDCSSSGAPLKDTLS